MESSGQNVYFRKCTYQVIHILKFLWSLERLNLGGSWNGLGTPELYLCLFNHPERFHAFNLRQKGQNVVFSWTCVYMSVWISVSWHKLQLNLFQLVRFYEMENIHGQQHQQKGSRRRFPNTWRHFSVFILFLKLVECVQVHLDTDNVCKPYQDQEKSCHSRNPDPEDDLIPNLQHRVCGFRKPRTCVMPTCANCWPNLFLITAF